MTHGRLGVELTVVAITRNAVRLGVSAPADVGVYREERCTRRGRRGGATEVVSVRFTP